MLSHEDTISSSSDRIRYSSERFIGDTNNTDPNRLKAFSLQG